MLATLIKFGASKHLHRIVTIWKENMNFMNKCAFSIFGRINLERHV